MLNIFYIDINKTILNKECDSVCVAAIATEECESPGRQILTTCPTTLNADGLVATTTGWLQGQGSYLRMFVRSSETRRGSNLARFQACSCYRIVPETKKLFKQPKRVNSA